MYRGAIEADCTWIDYLFEDGVILLGVGQDVLKEFVDYNAKIVMTSVGIEPFKNDVFNPCTWSNKYTKSSNVQTAQKEKISANYLLGKINMYTTEEFWSSL
jgi:ribonucleotide reductase beta subunit family protein with ferritin-like domain